MGYWRKCACEVLAMWNARANADMEKFRMGIDVHIVLLLDTDFLDGGICCHVHLVVDFWRHSCQ
jgi:hypothetical protein